MQIVIELSENIITGIAKEDFEMAREIVRDFQATIAKAIRNGTTLPKGHGRLIDAEDVDNHIIGHVDLRCCPTIIEADKETDG